MCGSAATLPGSTRATTPTWTKAYEQLLKYREALENPPLLVVSDMQQIVVHTNFTNTVKREIHITLDDLLDPHQLAQLRDVFLNPQAFYTPRTPTEVTTEAAKHFAQLAALLREQTDDSQRIAHFLIRLLFCLFAEDIGLLPEGLFSRLIRQTRTHPGAFTRQLRQLFAAMAEGGWFGTDLIPHFDGGLFDDDLALALDARGWTSSPRWPSWTGPASSRPSWARSSSAAWTPTSARSSARTTPAATTSC